MKLALLSAIFLQVAAAGAQVTPAGMWAIIRRPLWLARGDVSRRLPVYRASFLKRPASSRCGVR
jgi:hypothetical protein